MPLADSIAFFEQHTFLFFALTAWSLYWKAVALWSTVQRKERWWFLAFLLIQTFGILEMVYIFLLRRAKTPATEVPTQRVVVKALLEKDGKLLTLKKSYDNKGWDVPGGFIDPPEHLEQALRREIREEVGISKVTIGRLLTCFDVQNMFKGKLFYYAILIYQCTVDSNEEVKLSAEHTEMKWLTREEFALSEVNEPYRDAAKKLSEH